MRLSPGARPLVEALERKVADLAALQLELAGEHLALAERHLAVYDRLDRLADDLYAALQDGDLEAVV